MTFLTNFIFFRKTSKKAKINKNRNKKVVNEHSPYHSSSDNGLQIRVLGVPNTGAKSRVETQIKLCIQLMTKDKKVMDWSYIRIGETMLARSRLRKNQQVKSLDGSVATMVSDESKILQLEAKVVCASNTDQPIRMCVGCVRREVRSKTLKLYFFTNISTREKERKEQKMVNKRMNMFYQIRNSKWKEIVSCYLIVVQ